MYNNRHQSEAVGAHELKPLKATADETAVNNIFDHK